MLSLRVSVDSLATRPTRSVIAAAVLLNLALAFLLVIAAAILIDLLSEVGALALLDLIPAVAIGWLLFRGRSPHPGWHHNREISKCATNRPLQFRECDGFPR
jgi:hypothetical protein